MDMIMPISAMDKPVMLPTAESAEWSFDACSTIPTVVQPMDYLHDPADDPFPFMELPLVLQKKILSNLSTPNVLQCAATSSTLYDVIYGDFASDVLTEIRREDFSRNIYPELIYGRRTADSEKKLAENKRKITESILRLLNKCSKVLKNLFLPWECVSIMVEMNQEPNVAKFPEFPVFTSLETISIICDRNDLFFISEIVIPQTVTVTSCHVQVTSNFHVNDFGQKSFLLAIQKHWRQLRALSLRGITEYDYTHIGRYGPFPPGHYSTEILRDTVLGLPKLSRCDFRGMRFSDGRLLSEMMSSDLFTQSVTELHLGCAGHDSAVRAYRSLALCQKLKTLTLDAVYDHDDVFVQLLQMPNLAHLHLSISGKRFDTLVSYLKISNLKRLSLQLNTRSDINEIVKTAIDNNRGLEVFALELHDTGPHNHAFLMGNFRRELAERQISTCSTHADATTVANALGGPAGLSDSTLNALTVLSQLRMFIYVNDSELESDGSYLDVLTPTTHPHLQIVSASTWAAGRVRTAQARFNPELAERRISTPSIHADASLGQQNTPGFATQFIPWSELSEHFEKGGYACPHDLSCCLAFLSGSGKDSKRSAPFLGDRGLVDRP